jgi:5-methyltetrahydrofolate--homocysteine methyltransferase
VKVIIGGAPVTEEYANDIGADGFGADASRAASLANELVG